MAKIKKGDIVYFSLVGFLGAIHLLLLILLIDMFNIRLFGIILSFVAYALIIGGLIVLHIFKRRWFFKVGTGTVGLIVIIMLFNISAPITKPVSAVNYKNPVKTEIIEVEGGKIQGVLDEKQEVEIFTGIPYAKAPIGDLRWKEPQNVESWDGIKDCSYFAPKAMQDKTDWFFDTGTHFVLEKGWHIDYHSYNNEPMSEDCLYLNVFKPKNANENTPVLVFYHGGSLSSGSTAFSEYNGTELARKGIIFVNAAYRLNVFGYFALEELQNESPNHTTGNYGLLDQIKALKWVNDNIHYFKGDKNNITIAGESAGSSSVSAICTSPLAKGLFKRAIGESSSIASKVPPHTYRSVENAIEMGNDIKKEFKCNSLSDLRKIPAEKLVNTKYDNNSLCVDGYALSKSPYEVYLANEQNEESLLNGCNLDEAEAFTIPSFLTSGQPNKSNYKKRLYNIFTKKYADKMIEACGEIKTDGDAYRAYNKIISTYWFTYPHQAWSTLAKNNGETVYKYVFTKTNGYMSTWHSGEMIYCYNNIKNSKFQYRYDQSDYILAEQMSNYWVNYVKTGNPNGNGLPSWEVWTGNDNKVIELGKEVKMNEDPFYNLYPVFEEFEEYRYNNKDK